jgi:hypothetical protein
MNIHQHPIKYPFNPIEYHMKSQPKSNKIQQNLKKKTWNIDQLLIEIPWISRIFFHRFSVPSLQLTAMDLLFFTSTPELFQRHLHLPAPESAAGCWGKKW